MTTTYKPQVDAPAATDAEQRARTLEAAALELEVRGWGRGDTICEDGSVCLLGAIGLALDSSRQTPDCAAAIAAWDPLWQSEFDDLQYEGSLIFPAWWNDHVASSGAEVAWLLRWRAQEIRDLEGC